MVRKRMVIGIGLICGTGLLIGLGVVNSMTQRSKFKMTFIRSGTGQLSEGEANQLSVKALTAAGVWHNNLFQARCHHGTLAFNVFDKNRYYTIWDNKNSNPAFTVYITIIGPNALCEVVKSK